MRDHGSDAHAPVEETPVGRALDREQVPAVGDLEVLDLRRAVRQIHLVVEKLELPTGLLAPQRDPGREIGSVGQSARDPVGAERNPVLSGLLDRQ
jgi:hypothetical protein